MACTGIAVPSVVFSERHLIRVTVSPRRCSTGLFSNGADGPVGQLHELEPPESLVASLYYIVVTLLLV